MNASIITKDGSVTMPRWLWAIFCTGGLFLGGSVWESLASHNREADRRLGSHSQKLEQHSAEIATIRAELLTKEQASELLNKQRLEIKADFGLMRDEFRSLRQELRQ